MVSIIGTDRASGGYGAAKLAHERAVLACPIPARILRAAQFHEFVEVLMGWDGRANVVYLPKMRTQIVAARTVAEALADLALSDQPEGTAPAEIAGPREEYLPDLAALLAARRGDAGEDRGGQQPGRPGRRAQLERRPAARPARHPGRPDLRRMARRPVLTPRQPRSPRTPSR